MPDFISKLMSTDASSLLVWSLIAIVVSSLLGVFFARRKKDICLKDFQHYSVTVQHKNGKRIWGLLVVATSGVEFKYKANYLDDDHVETSFIMYKEEFGNLFILFRFLDQLDTKSADRRQKSLRRSYQPGPMRRSARWLKNTLNTLKDSITEAIGATLSQAKAINPAMSALSYQQKYVTKVQSEAMGMWTGSFDPILERHIGTRVVLEITTPAGIVVEHVGVFKEYSQQFVEIMDVTFADAGKARQCDMVVPRAHAQVRHSAEPLRNGGTVAKFAPPGPTDEMQKIAAPKNPAKTP